MEIWTFDLLVEDLALGQLSSIQSKVIEFLIFHNEGLFVEIVYFLVHHHNFELFAVQN